MSRRLLRTLCRWGRGRRRAGLGKRERARKRERQGGKRYKAMYGHDVLLSACPHAVAQRLRSFVIVVLDGDVAFARHRFRDTADALGRERVRYADFDLVDAFRFVVRQPG